MEFKISEKWTTKHVLNPQGVCWSIEWIAT